MGGVGVVEQRWSEEGSEEDDEPKTAENEESYGATGALCGYRDCVFGVWCCEGLIDHDFCLLYQHKLLDTAAGAWMLMITDLPGEVGWGMYLACGGDFCF